MTVVDNRATHGSCKPLRAGIAGKRQTLQRGHMNTNKTSHYEAPAVRVLGSVQLLTQSTQKALGPADGFVFIHSTATS